MCARAGVLCALVLVLGVRSFHGRTMECWTPGEFTPIQNDYVEEVCWATGTYFVRPADTYMPAPDVRDMPSRRLSWYQWLTFYLLIVAYVRYDILLDLTSHRTVLYSTVLY